MKETITEKDKVLIFCYFLATIILGVFIDAFQLNRIETFFVAQFQNIILYTIPVQVFVVITYLGDLRFLIILTILYLAYSYYKLRKMDNAFKLLAFLLIVTLFTLILKEFFRRERPFLYSTDVALYTYDNDYSYPSGHVSRSLGAYTIIFGKSKTGSIITTLLTTLISLSRIILGAHYFTDIIGATFLSLFSLKITSFINILNKRLRNIKNNI
ncbi:MAG: phosphatase PAP2 family protein [Nitrososphaeria archaeon]|nr:phosphatase PAP2 family protein [Nitrososphaeria archaeon]